MAGPAARRKLTRGFYANSRRADDEISPLLPSLGPLFLSRPYLTSFAKARMRPSLVDRPALR
jgi:hypothetical protein